MNVSIKWVFYHMPKYKATRHQLLSQDSVKLFQIQLHMKFGGNESYILHNQILRTYAHQKHCFQSCQSYKMFRKQKKLKN